MFCPQCGTEIPANGRFCPACGAPADPGERELLARELGAYTDLPAGVAGYGGFWRRFAAAIIDGLVLFLPLGILQAMLAPESLPAGAEYGVKHGAQGGMAAMAAAQWTAWDAVSIIAGWLYWAGLQSSPLQATVGKLALGMRVTDLRGQRISFLRATGRHFASYLSALLLMIGYLMVAFHPRKQGLHDLMAGTLVVRPR